ncbi:hypothetical protein F511_12400 [Dorcoceras hygrometricum]|uniref:Uncharacterized protein n=1 Tax=Dorcoceras hygrometricum TaxID=472368 RepID=A0A2Z7C6V3_9LAMI|nr:hypothetical protein F511_12400 [Dorcoceras hygrometricum]
MTSALMSSQSAVGYQQMKRSARDEATSCWESADGLVLMTSSHSADGLREQSQESAGSLHPDARGSDVVEEISSRKLQCNQQMLFGDSDSKTMSFT